MSHSVIVELKGEDQSKLRGRALKGEGKRRREVHRASKGRKRD